MAKVPLLGKWVPHSAAAEVPSLLGTKGRALAWWEHAGTQYLLIFNGVFLETAGSP